MLLFVATSLFATSCDEVEEAAESLFPDNEQITYVGTVDVSMSGITAYTNDAAEFVLEKDDETLTITMQQMKFSDYMPVTLDIQISDIPTDGDSFSIDEVIPTVSSIPMEDYTITNVSGNYSTNILIMTFECYGCDVSFTGVTE